MWKIAGGRGRKAKDNKGVAPLRVVHPSPTYAYLVFGIAGLIAVATVFAWGLWTLHGAVLVVGLLVATAIALHGLEKYLLLQFTTLTIYEHKVDFETGIAAKKSRSLVCARIESVKIDRTIGEMMLGLGTIRIDTGSESGQIQINNVHDPGPIKEQIMDLAGLRDRREPRDD